MTDFKACNLAAFTLEERTKNTVFIGIERLKELHKAVLGIEEEKNFVEAFQGVVRTELGKIEARGAVRLSNLSP